MGVFGALALVSAKEANRNDAKQEETFKRVRSMIRESGMMMDDLTHCICAADPEYHEYLKQKDKG